MQSHSFKRPSGDKSAKIRPFLSKAHRVPSILHAPFARGTTLVGSQSSSLRNEQYGMNRNGNERRNEMKFGNEVKSSLYGEIVVDTVEHRFY